MYIFAVLCLVSTISALPAPQDSSEKIEESDYSIDNIIQNLAEHDYYEKHIKPKSEEIDDSNEINDDDNIDVQFEGGQGEDIDPTKEKNQEDSKKNTELTESAEDSKHPVPVFIEFEDANTRFPIFSVISWLYCHWPGFPFTKTNELKEDPQQVYFVKVLLNDPERLKLV